MEGLEAVDPRIIVLAAQRAVVDERILTLMKRRLAAGYTLKLVAESMPDTKAAELGRYERGANQPSTMIVMLYERAIDMLDEQFERAYPVLRGYAEILAGVEVAMVPRDGELEPATQGTLDEVWGDPMDPVDLAREEAAAEGGADE